ncbi:MAG TPA: hypothetical protein PLA51_01255 [Spirochaetota bacterium]|jgi:hypothetical protein|nr:hypothetical protein [Spirochaetota bacterium]HRU64669.1 hypothetical protein [Spirochaetota bacterium]
MPEARESISEKAKRIETALKYTNGDMEKAKFMAGGKLQDIVALKGKFVVPDQNRSGAFIAFINVVQEYISAVVSITSNNTTTYTRLRIFDNWKSFYNNINAYSKSEDSTNSQELNEQLMTKMIQRDVFPDAQKMNLEYLSTVFQDIIKEIFQSEKAKSQLDIEKTNSMEVDLAGISIMVPEFETEKEESPTEATEEKSVPDTAFGKRLSEIESKASFVVEGCCVLSPVRGKPISEVTVGERIMVSLTAGDPVSEKVIDAYKARDHEGKPLPIIGRVIEIVPNEQSKGVILYALVAKGIYAKIVEEEPVRIQTEATQLINSTTEIQEEKPAGDWLTILIVIVFVILILSLVILFYVIS